MTEAHYTDVLLDQTGWIRKLARSLVSDPNVADDLVQETVVSALQHQPDTGRPVRAWLATVLRNHLGKYRATEAHRVQRQQAASSREPPSSTYEVVAKAAVQRDLVQAVLGLEEPYRTTVLLRFFERLSYREIGRRTGVTTATVNSRLTRGLAQLRTKLDGEYGDRSAWVMAFLPILPKGLAALETGSMTMSTVATLSALIVGTSVVGYTAFNSFGSAPAGLATLPAVAAPVQAAEPQAELSMPEPPLRVAAGPEVHLVPEPVPLAPVAGMDDGEHWETQLRKELVLGEHVHQLSLNSGAGDVVVEEGASLSVTALIRADLERVSPSQLTEYFEDHVLVSEEGEVMTIEDAHAKARERGWSVSLHVTTPRAVAVKANSGAGKVAVSFAAGAVDLNSGAGDVAVSMPRGELTKVRANSGAGAVEVDLSAAKSLTANSGAGAVEVRLRDTTGAESVSLGSGAGSLKLVVPGNVAGDFELETGVGEITLPPGLGLTVEKHQVGQEARGTVGYGGSTRFELSTGTGTIAVAFAETVY